MVKKIATVDLDDIVWDFNTPFAAWNSQHYNSSVTYAQITTFDLPSVYGIDRAEFNHRTQEFCHHHHDTIPILPGTVTFLETMQLLDITIHGVTSRWDSLQKVTLQHIAKHLPGLIAEVHFVNSHHEHHGDKAEICEELEALFHVEDALHHGQSVTSRNIPVLLHDKPWNKQADLPHRLYRHGVWNQPAQAWTESRAWVMARYGR